MQLGTVQRPPALALGVSDKIDPFWHPARTLNPCALTAATSRCRHGHMCAPWRTSRGPPSAPCLWGSRTSWAPGAAQACRRQWLPICGSTQATGCQRGVAREKQGQLPNPPMFAAPPHPCSLSMLLVPIGLDLLLGWQLRGTVAWLRYARVRALRSTFRPSWAPRATAKQGPQGLHDPETRPCPCTWPVRGFPRLSIEIDQRRCTRGASKMSRCRPHSGPSAIERCSCGSTCSSTNQSLQYARVELSSQVKYKSCRP